MHLQYRFLYIMASLFYFACPVHAQQSDSLAVRKLVNEIMTNGAAYENLRQLCSFGPRLSGSSGAENAVQLTQKMLRDAGADTTWLQPCKVTHWVRGNPEKGYLETSDGIRHELRLSALGNSVGSGDKPVCAELVEVTSFSQLKELGEKKLRGRIVFFNLAMDPTKIHTFRAYGESGVGRRSGPSQAARYGAIGVIVRSLASNVDPYPHTGATMYNDSFPKIPAVAISTEDAEWAHRQLQAGRSLHACFSSGAMIYDDVMSANVIGEIRGSLYPEEIITVGGHLDSWDLGQGAHDDGAGCVQAIEIIRTFKALGIHPKRTIRAVMFMNEENGTKGAKAYLDSAIARREKHLFALESDDGGFSPRGFFFEVPDPVFQKISRWKPLLMEYGLYEFALGGSGSDIGYLEKIGTNLAGLNTDSQRYFDVHHAATDRFEAVSRRELHLGAAAMIALVWLVSEYGL